MELDRLVTQLVQKARSLRSIVSKLHELRYPSENPLELADLIGRISQALEDETLKRYAEARRLTTRVEFTDQLRFSLYILRILAEDLRFVERAVTPHTPWSLIRPLEKLGQQIHSESYFIIRPQWSYNYSLRERISAYREYLERLLPKDSFEKVFKSQRKGNLLQIYVLGFPYLDRLSILTHALFGHELGHPIEKEYLSSEPTYDYLPKLIELVIKECKVPEDPKKWDLFATAKVSRMSSVVRELRRRALAEIICDLVCVNLFGLAALFATEEFALTGELDVFQKDPPGRHYPPWRYRLRVMFEECGDDWINRFLEQGKFTGKVTEKLRDKHNAIRSLVEGTDDKASLSKDPETRIAYESLEVAIPKVRKYVKDRLTEKGFSLDDLVSRVNCRLLDRLESWIPPDCYIDENNKEVVSDFRSVVNVGWIRWICSFASVPHVGDRPDLDEYFKQVDAINRLLLKAVEYIDIRHTIQEERNTG